MYLNDNTIKSYIELYLITILYKIYLLQSYTVEKINFLGIRNIYIFGLEINHLIKNFPAFSS